MLDWCISREKLEEAFKKAFGNSEAASRLMGSECELKVPKEVGETKQEGLQTHKAQLGQICQDKARINQGAIRINEVDPGASNRSHDQSRRCQRGMTSAVANISASASACLSSNPSSSSIGDKGDRFRAQNNMKLPRNNQ